MTRLGIALIMSALGCRMPDTGAATTIDSGPIARAPEPRPGVVVERLRIRQNPRNLDAILAGLPNAAPTPLGAEGLRSDGFLTIIIDEATLAGLERDLGKDIFVGRIWHGEATGWRSAGSRRLARGSAMLIDGRTRRIDDRILTLALRGWSLPTVDGAGVHVELVPYVVDNSIASLATPKSPGELRGIPLAAMLSCTLRSDEILLIASARELEVPAETEGESEPPLPASSTGIFSGPVMPLPPTPAGWLIDDPISGERGVLLIRGRPNPGLIPAP